ncbi:MAG: type II toxin-antitoxin system HicB family antitoxin [Parcubacteria group bacterium]|jgi:predicted RNase H-like HicB family nuclease|nr:type II toxin-antitoxin system HicB family antitoxin [Parcubacteria group bacterium]
MKNIIYFYVYKGEKCYIAEGVGFPVVTQAKTLDKLVENIKEAVELHLEGEDLSNYNLNPNPSILLNFEIGTAIYA